MPDRDTVKSLMENGRALMEMFRERDRAQESVELALMRRDGAVADCATELECRYGRQSGDPDCRDLAGASVHSLEALDSAALARGMALAVPRDDGAELVSVQFYRPYGAWFKTRRLYRAVRLSDGWHEVDTGCSDPAAGGKGRLLSPRMVPPCFCMETTVPARFLWDESVGLKTLRGLERRGILREPEDGVWEKGFGYVNVPESAKGRWSADGGGGDVVEVDWNEGDDRPRVYRLSYRDGCFFPHLSVLRVWSVPKPENE